MQVMQQNCAQVSNRKTVIARAPAMLRHNHRLSSEATHSISIGIAGLDHAGGAGGIGRRPERGRLQLVHAAMPAAQADGVTRHCNVKACGLYLADRGPRTSFAWLQVLPVPPIGYIGAARFDPLPPAHQIHQPIINLQEIMR